MARKQISQYLFDRLKQLGVDCTFGIPGDFVLPLYAAQQKSGLRTVVMTHEPSIGFAADAYGRVKGLGVALVTYGAGGLNMINATACAYAEESPLLVLSGGPEMKHRGQRALLHHCVKTFDSQNNVYAEVTATHGIVTEASTAQQKIDHTLEVIRTHSRPGYLELPRDMVDAEIEINDPALMPHKQAGLEPNHMTKLVRTIAERLHASKQPVIMVGVQISRFHLLNEVRKISETLNIPVISSIMGKSAFPESHANFAGIYFGQFGDDNVKKFVENSDCILVIGAVFTEMETGGFSAKLPAEKVILINDEEINICGERINYNPTSPGPTQMKEFIVRLTDSITCSAQEQKNFIIPEIIVDSKNGSPDELSVAHIIYSLNNTIDENICIVCDVGDCLYAGLSIKTDRFIAPGFYSSMGFGVPASIGVQIADDSKRPIVLVGDGGFQMTGNEIATAVKEKLSPIIVVFNNSSYAMLKFIDIDRDRSYYKLPSWDYVSFARALGAEGHRAESCAQFDSALLKALKCNQPVLIDAVLAADDISPTLKRLTELVGNKMRAGVKA